MKKTRWFIVLAGLTFAAQIGFYFYAASSQTHGNDPSWIAGFTLVAPAPLIELKRVPFAATPGTGC